MALPLNIGDLIHQRKVEGARIEYKMDWNPEKVLHSVCAFANDIDNWGGGYIILGVAEKNGLPVLPPKGIRKESVDAVNKELLNVCNLIEGRYVPVVSHEVYEGADILVLWCPASAVRPHKCPVVIAKNAKSEKAYYIRKASSTIRANAAEERELFEYAGKVPFDERPNMRASVSDIRMSLLLPFLESVGSDLAKDAAARNVADVARDMLLLEGPSEDEHPINAALMFFNEHPEKFFHYAWIEVVDKPDPTGQGMEEQTFKGPLDVQLRAALNYIRGAVLKEKIFKHDDRAEADRIWNYPYAAVEEVLANAVYHRSYEPCAPVEVTITPTQLEISSLPGLDRSITDANLKEFNIRSRFYRNRRIGEFLKELDLAEGRKTGIGKIVRAMRENGSPDPEFYNPETRSFMTVILPIHEAFKVDESKREAETAVKIRMDTSGTASGTVNDTVKDVVLPYNLANRIVEAINENCRITYDSLAGITGASRRTISREMKMLSQRGIIRRIGSDKSGHWEVIGKA